MMDFEQGEIKHNALLRACRYAGSAKALAECLGQSEAVINNWKNRGDNIPYDFALLIVELCKGCVTLAELRPDKTQTNQLIGRLIQKNDLSELPIEMINISPPSIALRAAAQASQQAQTGTTQTVIVDANYNLLVGFTHVMACIENKQTIIPVTVVDVEKHLADASPIPVIATNCRLQEKVIVGEIIREQLAKRRDKSSKNLKKCHGGDTLCGRIEDILAKLVGFKSRQSYRFAKTVCNTRNIKLISAVDNEKYSISFAADIAKFILPTEQDEFLKLDEKAQHKKIKHLSNAHEITSQF